MSGQANWVSQLSEGLVDMSLDISDDQQQKMLDYLTLLVKWNKAFNLTAIRDEQQMVHRQLLDSLSIVPYIEGSRILDVGTGAGLPGIPLAIMFPEKRFQLLDSNGKKTRFVQQAKMTLGLDNLEVVQSRVDAYRTEQGFDCITSRAFADLLDITRLTEHLLLPDGYLLAMKGMIPRDEIKTLALQGWRVKIETLNIPKHDSQRHAIICRR